MGERASLPRPPEKLFTFLLCIFCFCCLFFGVLAPQASPGLTRPPQVSSARAPPWFSHTESDWSARSLGRHRVFLTTRTPGAPVRSGATVVFAHRERFGGAPKANWSEPQARFARFGGVWSVGSGCFLGGVLQNGPRRCFLTGFVSVSGLGRPGAVFVVCLVLAGRPEGHLERCPARFSRFGCAPKAIWSEKIALDACSRGLKRFGRPAESLRMHAREAKNTSAVLKNRLRCMLENRKTLRPS